MSNTIDHMETVGERHIVQKRILQALLKHEYARYADMRPKGVESNLFAYHLKQLMAEKLVEKDDDGYRLTRLGKQYADRSSLATMQLRLQPKVITILVVRNQDGQFLILERRHQPFLGVKGFPSGKVHFGEDIADAAVRELQEKADISDVELTMRGNIIMRFMAGEDTVSHIIGYIFEGQHDGPCTQFENEHFISYWGDEDALYSKRAFKGHKEILELLSSSAQFITSYEFESDY